MGYGLSKHTTDMKEVSASAKAKKESFEEEEKEGSPTKPDSVEIQTIMQGQAEFPWALKYPRTFKYASDLLEKLEELGLDDLQIVLNEKGYAIWRTMPGDKHRAAVREIEDVFLSWKGDLTMRGEKESNVYVNESGQKEAYRSPDYCIFGSSRLNAKGRIPFYNGKTANPHVIFQFSWSNEIDAEKKAVDEMMMHAGKQDYMRHGRPNVAILIKALRRGKNKDSPVYGFDVYVVRQDETTPEAPAMKYRVGGQEDCEVVVDIGDMGLIEDVEDKDDLVIPVHRIREALEEDESGVAFVPAEAARNEI